MNKVYLLAFIMSWALSAYAQPDTVNFTIEGFSLADGTFSWRGTGTFHDMTNFDSSPFEEGHLLQGNTFRMNFRLLIPKGYDPNFDPGYPLMVMWHGAMEMGNCFDDNCYYGTKNYNPNSQPAPIPGDGSDLTRLLNNDHHLVHGGNYPSIHSWNAAGTRKITDPDLPLRAFPGFVLFPQSLNGWNPGQVRHALRIVRLMLKKYNIDQDRVYTHGLSNGAWGLLQATVEAPWLFAAAAPMSAVDNPNFRNATNVPRVAGIPYWFFQGGQDVLPTPQRTEQTIGLLRAAGGNVRYTLYPNLGHGTWGSAYREPDFITWFLGHIKSDIQVAYGSPTICGTTNEPARLSLPAGFPAYQWELNGNIIPGATSAVYMASAPGVYRARFSRVSENPTGDEWNRWSASVTVTEVTPQPPVLGQVGSVHLRDLNNSNAATLQGPPGFAFYYWYKDGVLTNLPRNTPTPTFNAGSENARMGVYTLATAEFDNCPSDPSNEKAVFFSNLAPVNITRPAGFAGTLSGPTSVLLRWNDVSGAERHYEIWRSKGGANPWTFVALTDEDAIQYEDRNLDAGTEYWYKLRAVSNEGRSDYAPGNNKTNRNQNLIVSTEFDNVPPIAPQNLAAALHDTDIAAQTASIRLTWDPAADAGGIKDYQIRYGDQMITVADPAASEYVVSGLPLNTTFDFRVTARDRSDNASPPSNQANASTFIDGFFWEHSTGAFDRLHLIPDDVWDNPEFKGRSANLTLEPALQDEFLVFRFYGYIYIPTAGMHQLRLFTNDGAEAYIDGELVMRRNLPVATGQCQVVNFDPSAPRYFEAGIHSIEVRYFQYTGSSCLRLEWRGPDTGVPNPDTWRAFPDVRVRSYGSPPVPVIPDAPTELVATANGMTQIDLSWNYSGEEGVEFELYRSATADGTYAIIHRSDNTEFSNTDLLPGTTYFYKVRTVSGTNISEFSNVASATTELDAEAPTQPTALTLYTQTLSTASIGWVKSEDNTGVIGYEVWINDVLHSTASSNFHLVEGLEPLRNYAVYVVAYDANGNKSAPSNTVTFDTSTPEIFYSKATGDLNDLATWGNDPDEKGGGDSPVNFTTNGTYFIVANREATTMGGNWSVQGNASRIIVSSGVTLTADRTLQGRVEVKDGGTLILANATVPALVNLGVSSTVQYNQSAQQIQRAEYGNLTFAGTADKFLAPGETIVQGNLQVGDGVAVKSNSTTQSTVVLFGDLIFEGTPAQVAPQLSVALDMRKSGTQNLTFSGGINLFRIKTTSATSVAFNTGENPGIVSLGSGAGGGLELSEGSSLHLGNNTLRIIQSGTINAGGQTGRIHVTEGTIDVSSASTLNSNLYFDTDENEVSLLRAELSSSGTLIAQTPVNITDGLKVVRGTFDANGMVTLISTPDKTANLQAIENNGVVIGDVNVQRYVSQKPRTYRYMSSPVAETKVSDWQEFFPITGPFDGTSTGSGLSRQHSLYIREHVGWVGYPSSNMPAPYNTAEAPIEKGRGYSAFIRNGSEVNMVNTGVPYQGTVAFDVFAPNESLADGDWNLLGNPYASTIRWTNDPGTWTKVDIGNVVAVRDNFNTTSGQFQYYDAFSNLGTGPGPGSSLNGGRIAQGQAFWVQATGPNPAISIHESAKSTGQQDFYREGASDISHLRINLRQNNSVDQALIVFTDFGSDGFDEVYDGLKMQNDGLFNFATLTEGNWAVAINNVSDEYCSKRLGLSLKDITPGTYSIELPSPETLHGGIVQLLDHFTGQSIDLMNETEYSFSVTSDAASYGLNRFELVISRPAIDLSVKSSVAANCNEAAQITLKNTQAGASYALFNSKNEPLEGIQTSIGNDLTFAVPAALLEDGINEFQVQASFKGCRSAMLPEKVIVEYYTPPTVTARDISVCVGSTATIEVDAAGSVSSYEWYTTEGPIKGVTGRQLTTGPVYEETLYLVNAVTPTGCAGPQTIISVSPETLAEPEILPYGDTLYTSVAGSEYTWLLNGEVLLNSKTAYYLVAEQSGEYVLQVRSGGCTVTSRAFVVTSTETQGLGSGIHLYPNPTTWSNINIEGRLSSPAQVRISILDNIGREIYVTTAEPDELKAQTRLKVTKALAPGIYFLVLEQDSRKEKIKFIVQE